MDTSRDVLSIDFHGEKVRFIASNDRLVERVNKLSNEKEVLDFLAKRTDEDSRYWDVGACLGIHTLTIASLISSGKVVAFEPMHANRGVLTDNVYANDLDNVYIERRALADETGKIEFAIRESFEAGWGRHSIATGDYEKIGSVTVPVSKGDILAGGQHNVPNIIKIDVEGAGPLVLEGLKNTLNRDECHTAVFETHEPNPVQPSHEDFGYTRDDIIKLLEDAGFSVSTLEHDYLLKGIKKKNRSNVGTIEIDVVTGDISKQSADAIVNAAGTSLRMGSGVAGALREKGGSELNDEAIRKGPIPLGSAEITDAYSLDSEYVIHAAAMPHYGKRKATTKSIKSSIQHTLELAEKNNCETIAIPAVGCGLAGVDLQSGTETIVKEIKRFDNDVIQSVTLVGYTEKDADMFKFAVKHTN